MNSFQEINKPTEIPDHLKTEGFRPIEEHIKHPSTLDSGTTASSHPNIVAACSVKNDSGDGPIVTSLPPEGQKLVKSSGIDPELAALGIYAAASSAAGKSFVITRGGSKTYPLLYLSASTAVAYGKSASADLAFGPLRAIEEAAKSRRQREQLELHSLIKRTRWAVQRLEKEGRATADEEEAKLNSDEATKLEADIQRWKLKAAWSGSWIYSIPTPAGLRRALEISPSGFVSLVASDGRSLAAELGAKRVSGLSISQILVDCFVGDPLTVLHGNEKEHPTVLDPRMSVMLLLQRDIGAELASNTESVGGGLGSRFCAFMFDGKRAKLKEPDRASSDWWKDCLQRIVESRPKDNVPMPVTLSAAAEAELSTFLSDYSIKLGSCDHDALRNFWSRAGDHLLRFALVRHIMTMGKIITPLPAKAIRDCHAIVVLAGEHLKMALNHSASLKEEPKEVARLRNALKKKKGAIWYKDMDLHGLKKTRVKKVVKENPGLFEEIDVILKQRGRRNIAVQLRQSAEVAALTEVESDKALLPENKTQNTASLRSGTGCSVKRTKSQKTPSKAPSKTASKTTASRPRGTKPSDSKAKRRPPGTLR